MTEVSRSLSFAITGEFVTRIAREWLWLEGKPWSTVEELLLSCMHGTDKSKEELTELAIKVVIGRAKFIGNTADGSYAMVEDNQDLTSKYIGQWNCKVKKLEKEYREIEDKYYALTGYLIDSGKGYLLSEAGVSDEDDDGYEVSPIVDSYLKQDKLEREGHTENYGWLDPQGNFYPVEFAEHQRWAWEKLKELGLIKRGEFNSGRSGDALVERGWALLHNPGMGVAYVTASETKPLTKAQREFLYGYYADRGLLREAAAYMEDG